MSNETYSFRVFLWIATFQQNVTKYMQYCFYYYCRLASAFSTEMPTQLKKLSYLSFANISTIKMCVFCVLLVWHIIAKDEHTLQIMSQRGITRDMLTHEICWYLSLCNIVVMPRDTSPAQNRCTYVQDGCCPNIFNFPIFLFSQGIIIFR